MREELIAEVEADPEFSWAGKALRALLDQNRARVTGTVCDSCGEVWAHRVTCPQNVERSEIGEV